MNRPPVTVDLHHLVVAVCVLCLSGAGGECHTPGCSFWMDNAPAEGSDLLAWLRSHCDTDEGSGG